MPHVTWWQRVRSQFKTPWAWGFAFGGLCFVALVVAFSDVVPPHATTVTRMFQLRRSIVAYVREHHRLPTAMIDMPMIDGHKADADDGWGRPIELRFNADETVSLISLGADGKPGGGNQDTDIIGTFDPRRPASDPWIRDPLGRTPMPKT